MLKAHCNIVMSSKMLISDVMSYMNSYKTTHPALRPALKIIEHR